MQFDGLVKGQISECWRQTGEGRDRSAADEDWHNRRLASERRANLANDVVILVTCGPIAENLQPSWPDHHEHGRACRQRAIDRLAEVLPRADVLDVDEDAVPTGRRADAIRESAAYAAESSRR
jgi:hypothetical protein